MDAWKHTLNALHDEMRDVNSSIELGVDGLEGEKERVSAKIREHLAARPPPSAPRRILDLYGE